MLTAPVRVAGRLRRYISRRLSGDPDYYLELCSGVIHVGASAGQERDLYARHQLKVAWIEPVPEQFEKLRQNIRSLPDQRAINALIADTDGKPYTFRVSNNDGLSSSILELHGHKDIWPDVHYRNCATVDQLCSYLKPFGFQVKREDRFACVWWRLFRYFVRTRLRLKSSNDGHLSALVLSGSDLLIPSRLLAGRARSLARIRRRSPFASPPPYE